MPRGSWKKRWIKLYVTGWLHGSIRWQFTSEERGVWADLIVLAGEIQKGGAICDNDERPLPRDFIANQLNIKLPLLERVIAMCIEEGRLEDRDGVLFVTNYEVYQSEYERQKIYRQRKPHLEQAQSLLDDPALGYGEDMGYSYEMFCQDYDALVASKGLGKDKATSQYFWKKYGWSKTDMKGTKICRLFMSAFNAIKANDEANPDNPSDEEVAKETLESLQKS